MSNRIFAERNWSSEGLISVTPAFQQEKVKEYFPYYKGDSILIVVEDNDDIDLHTIASDIYFLIDLDKMIELDCTEVSRDKVDWLGDFEHDHSICVFTKGHKLSEFID